MAITDPKLGTMDVPQAPPSPALPAAELDTFPYPPTDLLESDGVPLESHWHVRNIHLLLDVVGNYLQGREDYYAGGNMFIYFSREQARTLDYRGPDFFFVNGGVTRTPMRPYWAIWNEGGRSPDVIIELMSPTTKKEDLTTKKEIYEKRLKTHEYYCYDPDTQELLGWRLNLKYERITPNDKGWLWSEEFGLWLGTWMGPYGTYTLLWLRFYDAAGNIVPTFDEAAGAKAEAAHQLADAAHQLADAAKQRADAEHQRADALEAELAALKSQFASRTPPTS
jgi:Uma2 family endonuclease